MRSFAFVLASLLAACTGPTDSTGSTFPAIDGTPRPPSVVLPAEALPVPDASPWPWPIRPGDKRAHASSPDVGIGQVQPFKLYTHCGIDFRVDFDESFWQSYPGERAAPVGDPDQRGTMTLLTDRVAVFRYRSQGSEASIYFVRNDTPRARVRCD
jgi:hypothetical protein